MRGVRAARRNPERSRGYSARTAIAISARRASLSLRLVLLRLIFLIPRMLLINRILARRPPHANGDLHLRLVDVVVIAKSLESLGQHLHRSEEHTSELQSPDHLVCRLLLEKKKKIKNNNHRPYN